MTLAKAVVASRMAPKGLETPEACMVAILHGLEVGLTPLMALQRIAVIDGRPTIWGDAALALVRSSGQCRLIKEWVQGEGPDDWTACCAVQRRSEPEALTRQFSVADAKQAGLWGQPGPWSGYPRRMLQMRARAFALRDGFADVLGGLYLREEFEDRADLGDAQTARHAQQALELDASEHHSPVQPFASGSTDGRPPLPPERPRRARGGWTRLRAPREAIRLRAPPPPLFEALGEEARESAQSVEPPLPDEAVVQLYDDALACAADASTLAEVEEEFSARLGGLSREALAAAGGVRERHHERVRRLEAGG
ncbi:hypothetical protein [Alsobacter soli]|nr:hypothetical protein [Alsobacter soli]